jgi:hypothetical protein
MKPLVVVLASAALFLYLKTFIDFYILSFSYEAFVPTLVYSYMLITRELIIIQFLSAFFLGLAALVANYIFTIEPEKTK